VRTPASSDLRRDLGIWAGILGLLHTAVGQNVHLRGRPWLYYVYAAREHHTLPLRHDLFGFANETGAAACLILALLLATSNDYALRRLQVRRWKNLQRLNYGLFPLAAVHGFAYQAIEKQKWPFVLAAGITIALAAFLQLAGLMRGRRGRQTRG
jgi:sulfoxide reductase heme-binding subunit YedZ